MARQFLMVIMTAFIMMPAIAHAQDELISEDHMPSISALAEAEYVSGILHPATLTVGSAGEISFVLKFALKDDWYMYWRTPGDSGLAPVFDWSTSKNIRDVTIGWPAPKRFEQDGMYSFGYDGIVELPVTATLTLPGQAATLNLDTSLIVCSKICVPQKLMIVGDVPAGAVLESPYDQYFIDVKNRLPMKDGDADMRLQTAVLGKSAIVVTMYGKGGFDGTDIFVESDAVTFTAKPVMEKDPGNDSAAIFRIEAPEGTDDLTSLLLGKSVTVTAVRGSKAIEKTFSF